MRHHFRNISLSVLVLVVILASIIPVLPVVAGDVRVDVSFKHYKTTDYKEYTFSSTPTSYTKGGVEYDTAELLEKEHQLREKQSPSGKEQEKLAILDEMASDSQYKLSGKVIFDTPVAITARGISNTLKETLLNAGIERPHSYVWIDGATDIPGEIVFRDANVSRVFVTKGDPDRPTIIDVPLGKDGDKRPYYTREKGEIHVFVDGFSGAGTEADPWQVATADDLQNVGRAWINLYRYNVGMYAIGSDNKLYVCKLQLPSDATTDNTPYKPVTGASWATYWDLSDGGDFSAWANWGMADYYKMTADIDLSAYGNFIPIGHGTGILYINFTGSFDGDGHTISDMTISQASDIYVALFAGCSGATISNVGIVDCNVTGMLYACSVIGYAVSSTITNSFATGAVTANGNYSGGFAATLSGSTVTESYADVIVNTTGSSSGGFTGKADSSTIVNCYARGDVTSDNFGVGGFVGNNYRSHIENCYSTGKPTGTTHVGGFVGLKNTGGNYADTNNFWDTTTSETATSAMGTGKTTAQMMDFDTFDVAGWDIAKIENFVAEIWIIDDGIDYPIFGWTLTQTAPTITASAATNITAITARLNAEIPDDGNVALADVTAYWGETDEGEVPLSWTFSDTLTDQVLGTMHFDIDTLDPETLYYFKFAATNTEGTGWSTTLSFTTDALTLCAPTNLTLTDLGGSTVKVEWVKGINTTNTMVRISRTDYPAAVDEGELLYYDTGTTVNVTGWNLDFSTLYVSAWGYDVDDITYSDDYATATIGGENMLLGILLFVGLCLTCTMIAARKSLLGFPSGIFWALAGAQAFTLSTATWDLYFVIGFASVLGMVTFSVLGAYAVRERHDSIAEEEFEDGEGKYIDETTNDVDDSPQPSRYSKAVRQRAARRRPQGSPPKIDMDKYL